MSFTKLKIIVINIGMHRYKTEHQYQQITAWNSGALLDFNI